MAINRRDIIQILRDENELLKLRNKQVSAKLAHQQQAFRMLAELDKKTRSLIEELDLPDVLNSMLAMVMHACNSDNGSLLLIDEDNKQLEFVAVIGESHEHLLNHRIDLETGIVGHVIKHREPMLLEDVHASREWSPSIDERLDFHTHSLMCVPLTSEDVVVGAIEIVNRQGEAPYDENDLNILHVAGRLASQVLECVEQKTLKSGDN